MLRAFAALWLLAAAPASATDSPEAVCSLRALFTAQKSYLQEKDRYSEVPAHIGFAPDECVDGTQALSPHPVHARGCHFIYSIETLGPQKRDFRAEALGVVGPWKGTRFELRGDGRVLRADGSLTQVKCEEAPRELAPLVRFFETVQERDCTLPPPSPSHACHVALSDMVRLANEGMGLAQRLYAARPFARALKLREPVAPFISLCATDERPQEERERAAETLAQRGALAEAVLSRHCGEAGVRTGLRRLLAPGAAPCPGTTCLPLLALARKAPEHKRVLQTHTKAVAAELMALRPSERASAFNAVLGHSTAAAAALAQLMEGTPVAAGALPASESDPVTARLILDAEQHTPQAALALRASRELASDGGLSAPTFEELLTSDCASLDRALPRRLSPAQLQRLSKEAARCPDLYVSRLAPEAAGLPAKDLPALLAPLSPEQRAPLRDKLGLHEGPRAEALVVWVAEHAPELLPAMHITKEVARQLLSPELSRHLGGRSAVREALVGVSADSNWRIHHEAYELLTEDFPWPLPARPPRVPPGPPPGDEPSRSGDFGLLRVVEDKGTRDLYVQTPGSSVERRLTTSGRVAGNHMQAAPVALSPDRRQVAYAEWVSPPRPAPGASQPPYVSGWSSLHVVRTDGKEHRLLVELGAPPPGMARQEAGSLVWSDDGTRLAYAVHTHGGPGTTEQCPSTELFEVQLASGAVRRIPHERLRGRVRLVRWRSTKPELVLEEECGPEGPLPPRMAEPTPTPDFAAWLDLATGSVLRRWSSGKLSLSPDGSEAFREARRQHSVRHGSWPGRAEASSAPHPVGVFEEAGLVVQPRLPLGIPSRYRVALLWLHREPSALAVLHRLQGYAPECAGVEVPEPTLARLDLLTGASQVLWRQRSGVRILSLSPDDAWVLVGLLTGATEPALMCGPLRYERMYAVRLQDLERTASLRELRERAIPLTPPRTWNTDSAGYLGWVRR
ncbi:hypothetical protein [Pyxidicoccus xibeiensis]|uniref:hypothetical protein n=1 Tax=Pyxidicoccus xibeiensis TaxID=2906759 RepID=UPI0020A7860A|nr:hypothetical protein [Pyxidicoccus xibeiensis]MCP3142658.1 hypothetical protein [Pyxidicoccus xibeiensis]